MSALASLRSFATHLRSDALRRPRVPESLEPPSIGPSRFVTIEGRRVAVYERGDAGPRVLFLHGMPVNAQIWAPLMARLAPRARCVALDVPGFGASEHATDATSYARLHAWLDAAIGALSDEPVVLVVHDALGPPGIVWAAEHPDRVRGLVVLNTTLWPELDHLPLTLKPFIHPASRKVLRPLQRPALVRPLIALELRKLFARSPRLPGARLELFWRQFADGSAKDAFLDWVWNLPESQRWMRANAGRIEGFARPVQLIWGMRDPIFVDESITRFARAWPQARVARIADAGHFLQYEAADEVGAEIGQFLETLAP